ncbi:unnamed protein product [Prorocentrum cordatum]|uniref:Calcineurin-like phosphoesterase domain-containing protein n=1 Tax=Prorocentrum cordatum TaxID=2364126 RepID=A0ABN9UZK1_9DINO|nr:unnamed protein product [Polarella glacialis]
MEHNLCGLEHNVQGATCGPMGPTSVYDCPNWFKKLWNDQVEWMETHLRNSDATWQVVVTHFPPLFGKKEWTRLAKKYGIDLIVSGHRHMQEVHSPEEDRDELPEADHVGRLWGRWRHHVRGWDSDTFGR